MKERKFFNLNIILFVVILAMLSVVVSEKMMNKQNDIKTEFPTPVIISPTVQILSSTPTNTPILDTDYHGVDNEIFKYTLNPNEIYDIRGENRSVGLLETDAFSKYARYYREMQDKNHCVKGACFFDEKILSDGKTSSVMHITYNDSGIFETGAADFVFYGDTTPRILDELADKSADLINFIFSNEGFSTDKDYKLIKSLALNFFSNYIPENPVIPAVNMFRFPGYYLTFIMGKNTFSVVISANPLRNYGIGSLAT